MKISMPSIGLSCFLYFDFDKFAKEYELSEDKKMELFDCQGCQCGNGVYINLDAKSPITTSTHEISHYLDWVFEEVFTATDLRGVTEIRARLSEYLFDKISEKIVAKLEENNTKKH